MSSSTQPSFYAIIPANVRYCKELEPNAKLLYGEIFLDLHLGNHIDEGKYADLFDVDRKTVLGWMLSLIEAKFLERILVTDEFIVSHLKSKYPTRLPPNTMKIHFCSWCKSQTYILQEHHHPIRKRYGGKKTVKICASCHSEFHYLSDSKIQVKIPDQTFEKESDFLRSLGVKNV